MNSPIRILLDSTFLLPTLGVKVAQVSDSDLRELARFRSRASFFCLHQSLVEVLGKIAREVQSERTALATIEAGFRSLLESGVYTWISPSVGALLEALEMRTKGHSDMIDNMLYATASERRMLLLSLDRDLTEFLAKNGYPTDNIVDTKRLRTLA
jgi:rRNA-processing protein FCF1